jgi:hypothetical protein
MSKWATIDREKLEREIDLRAAAINAMGSKVKGFTECIEASRLLAEHNALVAVFNSISQPDAPAERDAP